MKSLKVFLALASSLAVLAVGPRTASAAPPAAPAEHNSEWTMEIQPGVTVGDVVGHFAPVWYHDTASGGPDNLGPRMDYYMALDYDGEMQQDNQWEHLENWDIFPVRAVLYYSIKITSTHYFLTFSQYHPRDWEQVCTGLFTECHEGDMESIWMIIQRTPDGYGTPWVVHTGAHGEKYWWTNEPGLLDNVGDEPNGQIDFESDAGEYSATYDSDHSHLRVFTQAHGHGPIVCRARETGDSYLGFEFDPVKCAGDAPYEDGTFSGDDGIVFRFSNGVATEYASAMEDFPYAEVDYAFYSYLDTIWPYRTDAGNGRVFWNSSDYRYKYEGVRCTEMGDPDYCFAGTIWFKYDPEQFLVENSGNAAWSSDWGTGRKGDLFFDPAVTWFWKFNLVDEVNAGTYSLNYDYNPFIGVEPEPGTIQTVAGKGSEGYGGDGGLATDAKVNNTKGVFVAPDGTLYIADKENHRIRKVYPATGIITTVAGTGSQGYGGDGGPATNAKLNDPYDVFLDEDENMYIADNDNHRVRKVDTNGTITTVAGNGSEGYNGDGIQATQAKLNNPKFVYVDPAGNLYIGDDDNHRIRKVGTDGIITTVAGTGSAGYNGDGIQATQAKLYNPKGVVMDEAGNLYIGDDSNHRIRKVGTDGIITTVAGTGGEGYNGDGIQATQAKLNNLEGIALDVDGNLYIADDDNHRIRKVDLATGIITTVAGTGGEGYNGDGQQATQAKLNDPKGVFVDNAGNIFISDDGNHRIRKVNAL